MGGKVLDYEAKRLKKEGEENLIKLIKKVKEEYGEKSEGIINDILLDGSMRKNFYEMYGME